ncbi:MAG: sigma-70 family RNA polymerase sigma factor [Verrucomicrobiota bacterium]
MSGWLYHTTRLTAANFQRAEFRRIHREQEAFMQSTMEESAPDAAWRAVAPLLDEAMARLGATDRDAVVLRYFENKSLAEVGTALGVEERAAQKRVTRALEKLRKIFSKRGVTLDGRGYRRRGLGQLGPSRAGRTGRHSHRRGGERNCGGGINHRPCGRNYENDDVVKNEILARARSRGRGNWSRYRNWDRIECRMRYH